MVGRAVLHLALCARPVLGAQAVCQKPLGRGNQRDKRRQRRKISTGSDRPSETDVDLRPSRGRRIPTEKIAMWDAWSRLKLSEALGLKCAGTPGPCE